MQSTIGQTRKRVLVVEDHADGRKSLTLLLKQHGYEVSAAADGPAGLAEALSWHPDAVVCDIGLPGMDGWTLAARVRAQLGDAVLLIALTGYGSREDMERSLRAGFDSHLTKPSRPEALLRLLGPPETTDET